MAVNPYEVSRRWIRQNNASKCYECGTWTAEDDLRACEWCGENICEDCCKEYKENGADCSGCRWEEEE